MPGDRDGRARTDRHGRSARRVLPGLHGGRAGVGRLRFGRGLRRRGRTMRHMSRVQSGRMDQRPAMSATAAGRRVGRAWCVVTRTREARRLHALPAAIHGIHGYTRGPARHGERPRRPASLRVLVQVRPAAGMGCMKGCMAHSLTVPIRALVDALFTIEFVEWVAGVYGNWPIDCTPCYEEGR